MAQFDARFPIIIAGAGGAGLFAALTAASRGVDVLLLEKDGAVASNMRICGGLVPAAGTAQQRAAGIADSPALMAADVMRGNGGVASPAVVAAICNGSAQALDFLAERTGLVFHLYRDILHSGLSAHRLHASVGETGAELEAAMRDAAHTDARIEFRDGHQVTCLIVERGKVMGVTARTRSGTKRFGAEAVVLATCGFGANQAMLRRHCPEIADAYNMGSANSSGDGIGWAEAAGAALDYMSGYQGHAHANPDQNCHLGGSLPRLGAILVNLEGRRFGREDQSYSSFGAVILRQPKGRALELWDERIHGQARSLGPYREAMAAGAIKSADTVAELAEIFAVPVAALEAEVAEFNRACAAGHDRLGRQIFGAKLTAPFHGAIVTGAIAHTQGGVRIDARARALRGDGTAIPGLYAVGGTAAGMSGIGGDGYLSGNGLAHAFGTGALAGAHAAEAVTG